MTFQFERRALRDLAELSRADAKAIVDAVALFTESGVGDVRKLRGMSPPVWRLRVGRFRVRWRREGSAFVIFSVRDRRDAYR